jgi:uncharacterized protein with NRDE domain
MCLIVFAWRPEHDVPLLLAANRDEFYARPTLPLAAWEDAPQVLAGRDLEAGGTWLGLGPGGRFAALTNIRDPLQPPGHRSRGDLVARFLTSGIGLDDYLREVRGRSAEYAGFNLLLGIVEPGQAPRLMYFNARRSEPVALAAGVYGLSNAALDAPWPKLIKAREALAAQLDDPLEDELLAVLNDPEPAADADLPDTGVGLATEKLLSSVFIASPSYGTRASTLVTLRAGGRRRIVERSYGPYGGHLGEVIVED